MHCYRCLFSSVTFVGIGSAALTWAIYGAVWPRPNGQLKSYGPFTYGLGQNSSWKNGLRKICRSQAWIRTIYGKVVNMRFIQIFILLAMIFAQGCAACQPCYISGFQIRSCMAFCGTRRVKVAYYKKNEHGAFSCVCAQPKWNSKWRGTHQWKMIKLLKFFKR